MGIVKFLVCMSVCHSTQIYSSLLFSSHKITFHTDQACVWLSFVTDVMYRIVFKLCQQLQRLKQSDCGQSLMMILVSQLCSAFCTDIICVRPTQGVGVRMYCTSGRQWEFCPVCLSVSTKCQAACSLQLRSHSVLHHFHFFKLTPPLSILSSFLFLRERKLQPGPRVEWTLDNFSISLSHSLFCLLPH